MVKQVNSSFPQGGHSANSSDGYINHTVTKATQSENNLAGQL